MTQRLDLAIVSRGLASSRNRAAKIIQAGLVTVNGKTQNKPSTPVEEADEIEVLEDTKWVSRAALKLLGALENFGVNVNGRLGLDLGSSTGGFTQVLLASGASKVLSVDVGHSQMDPIVANDPRVINLEKTNAKELDGEKVAQLLGGLAQIVVADVSFISITHLFPAIRASTAVDADMVLLIKPQFEVGKGNVKQGIVIKDELREQAVEKVVASAQENGFIVNGIMDSPIVGTHGNHEYLIWLRNS